MRYGARCEARPQGWQAAGTLAHVRTHLQRRRTFSRMHFRRREEHQARDLTHLRAQGSPVQSSHGAAFRFEAHQPVGFGKRSRQTSARPGKLACRGVVRAGSRSRHRMACHRAGGTRSLANRHDRLVTAPPACRRCQGRGVPHGPPLCSRRVSSSGVRWHRPRTTRVPSRGTNGMPSNQSTT